MPVEIWGHMKSVFILNALLTAMANLLATIQLWFFEEKVCKHIWQWKLAEEVGGFTTVGQVMCLFLTLSTALLTQAPVYYTE